MKIKLAKKYYLIPAVYLLLIIGFLHLHLNESGGRYITHNLGPVTVRYRQESGVRKSVSRLIVNISGMSADLSNGVPVHDPGGRNDLIGVKEVLFEDNQLNIVLSRGGTIEIAKGFTLSEGIHVTEDGNGQTGAGFAIVYRPGPENIENFFPVLKFSLPSNTDYIKLSAQLPLISLDTSGQKYLIVHNYNLTAEDQEMVIRFHNNRAPGFFNELGRGFRAVSGKPADDEVIPGIVAEPVSTDDVLAYWFFGDDKPVNPQEAENVLQNRLSGIMSFLSGMGAEDAGKTVSAFAAQSLREYGRINMDQAEELYSSARQSADWSAAPFVGNIVEAEQKYSQRERRIVNQLVHPNPDNVLQLLADSIKATEYPSILSNLVFAGDEDVLLDYELLLEDLLAKHIDNSSAAAGLFELVVDGTLFYPEKFQFLQAFLESSYQQILPYIIQIDSQLMYQAFSDGESDDTAVIAVNPLVQLRLARTLNRYSGLTEDKLAAELGSALVLSALSAIGSDGILPAEIVFRENNFQPAESGFTAAEFYPFMTENNYYPRVVSLQKELGRDIRLWTSAKAVGALQRPDGYEITLDFAVGETEYLVMRGIEAFTSLEMYGLAWGGDWRFQNYDVGGWFYDRERSVLYMKIRHKEKVERIRIYS